MTSKINDEQCINELQILKDRADCFLDYASDKNEQFRIGRDNGSGGSKNYSLEEVPYGEEVYIIEELIRDIDKIIDEIRVEGIIDELDSCEDFLALKFDGCHDSIRIIEDFEAARLSGS
ncbi:hypothetical protein HAP94_15870 [Acidithiobacillus ferrivorans]|nr:hypothetical protein [Acidithiobacillus ferrivorans]